MTFELDVPTDKFIPELVEKYEPIDYSIVTPEIKGALCSIHYSNLNCVIWLRLRRALDEVGLKMIVNNLQTGIVQGVRYGKIILIPCGDVDLNKANDAIIKVLLSISKVTITKYQYDIFKGINCIHVVWAIAAPRYQTYAIQPLQFPWLGGLE